MYKNLKIENKSPLLEYIIENNLEKIEERARSNPEEINKRYLVKHINTGDSIDFPIIFWIYADPDCREYVWLPYNFKKRDIKNCEKIKMLKILIENGADINMKSSRGMALIHLLLWIDDFGSVEDIFKNNCGSEIIMDTCDGYGKDCYDILFDSEAEQPQMQKIFLLFLKHDMRKMMKEEIEKKSTEINRKIDELKYLPENSGYLSAKDHFEKLNLEKKKSLLKQLQNTTYDKDSCGVYAKLIVDKAYEEIKKKLFEEAAKGNCSCYVDLYSYVNKNDLAFLSKKSYQSLMLGKLRDEGCLHMNYYDGEYEISWKK